MDKDRYQLLRSMDRTMGSALLRLLGAARRLRSRRVPQPVRSVALIKADGLGDLVLLTAVAQDLRAGWPEARRILLCGPFNYPLARLLTVFDEIVCLTIANPLPAILELRRKKLDVCLDFGQWSRLEALIAFFSGARFTAGFDSAGQHRHYAYDLVLPHRRDQHEVDNYRDIVRALGVPATHAPKLELAPGCAISESERARLASPPYAVLHLWSGSARYAYLKEWPLDRWAAVVRWLRERGYTVHLTGGSADAVRTRQFLEKYAAGDEGVRDVTGLSFPGLLHLLENATVVVSIDTSVPHIAAALGTRVLSLHGPSSSKRWGAVGPRAEAIDTPCPGCGYMNWGADSTPEKAKLKCMEAISVEAVLSRLEWMLA